MAVTPVAPPPVAPTPVVTTPVAKAPAPAAAPVAAPPVAPAYVAATPAPVTPVVAPPVAATPVAIPNLPEPDLFVEAAPPVVVEEPAKKKSLASKLWAAVPKPKKAAPPPSIMAVPEDEAADAVSAPAAFVAPAAPQAPAVPVMPAAASAPVVAAPVTQSAAPASMPPASSGAPVVQAAPITPAASGTPVAQPTTVAPITPTSAKPAAQGTPVAPAVTAPVAPVTSVAPAARVNTPAASNVAPAAPSSPQATVPPQPAAATPAVSMPADANKSTTFDWHKDVAVSDALPAWARGRVATDAPAGNEGAVDFDEASGSLSAQVASASADRVSAFMAAPKPVIKPEPVTPAPSSSASSSSSTAAPGMESSSDESRALIRPGSGFLGADAATEAEDGEKVVAFKAPRRQMPRIRINWRRTLAASLVVSIMEGVAFATAYWYVNPTETGSLLVETTPAGLEILVDGRVMGRTPFSDSLTPGRHTIELRQGQSSRVIPVEISSGVQTMQRIRWNKGLQTGQARVTATAPNSEVTIDGKKWGKAPLTVSTLAAGKHMVQIESDSGTVSTPIAVSPGETTELDVPIYPGWVSVLAPVQLFIYSGERFLGTTEGEKLMLAPGKHKLDFVSEELGYKRSLEVTITPGATAAVSLPMPKVAVTVEGPEGADLIVDGEFMGKLPLTGLQVPLGTRDFVVKHPDHGEKRQVVTVTSHAPMRVTLR